MRPAKFYRIRFARIAPLLLLLLAVLSLLHLGNVQGFRIPAKTTTLPRALFAALTFHLNWLEAVHGYLPGNWDVLWSLSVEEMFYLFFPLICVALLRLRRGMPLFVLLLLTFAVMGPFARTVWTTNPIWQEKTYLGGMDGIALGCLCALVTDQLLRRSDGWRRAWSRRLVAIEVVGGAMVLWIAVWPPWHWMRYVGRSGVDGTVLALGACLVMVGSVVRGHAGGRWMAPIRWFGRHSYEVYLTHEFVVLWGTMLYVKFRRGPLSLWFLGILLLTAPLGWVAARYFSEPMNRRLRGAVPPKNVVKEKNDLSLSGRKAMRVKGPWAAVGPLQRSARVEAVGERDTEVGAGGSRRLPSRVIAPAKEIKGIRLREDEYGAEEAGYRRWPSRAEADKTANNRRAYECSHTNGTCMMER